MRKTNDHYAFFLIPHLIQMPPQYCFHNTKLKKLFKCFADITPSHGTLEEQNIRKGYSDKKD